MCGRYVQISKIERLESRFNALSTEAIIPYNPNVTPGEMAPVITGDSPRSIQCFRFGMTASWSKKGTLLINARSEGDHNPDNDPHYHGAKGIITKPSFKHAIRHKRCLVLADAFMEGPEKAKLSKPYLVYLQKKERPFAFAGLWNAWVNPENGLLVQGFAIITAPANGVMERIGHHRSPVILRQEEEGQWLSKSSDLKRITSMLNPWPTQWMNAYPIDPKIKRGSLKDIRALMPIGERVMPDQGLHVTSSSLRPDGIQNS